MRTRLIFFLVSSKTYIYAWFLEHSLLLQIPCYFIINYKVFLIYNVIINHNVIINSNVDSLLLTSFQCFLASFPALLKWLCPLVLRFQLKAWRFSFGIGLRFWIRFLLSIQKTSIKTTIRFRPFQESKNILLSKEKLPILFSVLLHTFENILNILNNKKCGYTGIHS